VTFQYFGGFGWHRQAGQLPQLPNSRLWRSWRLAELSHSANDRGCLRTGQYALVFRHLAPLGQSGGWQRPGHRPAARVALGGGRWTFECGYRRREFAALIVRSARFFHATPGGTHVPDQGTQDTIKI